MISFKMHQKSDTDLGYTELECQTLKLECSLADVAQLQYHKVAAVSAAALTN